VSPRRKAQVDSAERFPSAPLDGPLLEVDGIKTHFKTPRGLVRAVDGVSFSLERGRTLGVVGESGSGKTVLSRSIMGLLPKKNVVREGSVRFENREIGQLPADQMRHVWGSQMAMVFQDPMTSLNPVMRVGKQITESLLYHLDISRTYAKELAVALLASVGIPEPERRMREYPHQLSGGMRQRVMIAIALACGPKLLFADEPTTALDVTVQAQILDLLQSQQRERFMAMILVTHDLGIVARFAQRVAVMYGGRFVEVGTADEVFHNPQHPYTAGLLRSIPRPTADRDALLYQIDGSPPDPTALPAGCPFGPRCSLAIDRCRAEVPPLTQRSESHEARCWVTAADPAAAVKISS
jgi:peptide/nickel transport system ATP-binding protein